MKPSLVPITGTGLFSFMLDLEKYNGEVKTWGKKTRTKMINTGKTMGIRHRSNSPSDGDSLSKIRDRYKEANGTVNEVRFSNVARPLIFAAVGAGKGVGGAKGSTWIDKYGNKKKTNPESLNKIGTGLRPVKNFILVSLDGPEGVDALGTIAATNLADAIVTFKPNNVLSHVNIKK